LTEKLVILAAGSQEKRGQDAMRYIQLSVESLRQAEWSAGDWRLNMHVSEVARLQPSQLSFPSFSRSRLNPPITPRHQLHPHDETNQAIST
jgi:hypothetical protein